MDAYMFGGINRYCTEDGTQLLRIDLVGGNDLCRECTQKDPTTLKRRYCFQCGNPTNEGRCMFHGALTAQQRIGEHDKKKDQQSKARIINREDSPCATYERTADDRGDHTVKRPSIDLFSDGELKRLRSASELDRILAVVAWYFKIPESEILSRQKKRRQNYPRNILYWIARVRTQLSLPDIGGALSQRNHTTVLRGVVTIDIDESKKTRDHLRDIQLILDRLDEVLGITHPVPEKVPSASDVSTKTSS